MKWSFDRSHLVAGLLYGALGMGLGIYMAASHDHGQHVTHAHLLLVGFLLSVIYALIHRLWLVLPGRAWATLQFGAHHLGLVAMIAGLFLLYGGFAEPATVEPLLGASSILVLLALILMLLMVIRSWGEAVGQTSAPEIRRGNP
jgi:hypothetical protein